MPGAESLADQLLGTWLINHRINVYLLENLTGDQLQAKAPKSKSVAGHFAHQHNVRLMWLKASAPELGEGLEKLEESAEFETIQAAHVASTGAIEKLLARALESGRVKNFKPHPAAFLGYLLAHESFHRSQAELVLRQAGLPLTDKVAYGLWEWGAR